MKHLVIVLGLSLLCKAVSAGPVRVYFDDPTTRNFTYLESDLLKITIAKHQGKIVGWFLKEFNTDIALAAEPGWGVVAQRLGVFDAGRAGLNIWPDGWPTPIGTGDYETEIVAANSERAVVKQTLTVGEGFMITGIQVEKYYTFYAQKYQLDIRYEIKNTSGHVISSLQGGHEFGLTLTVETTGRLSAGDNLAFQERGKVHTLSTPVAVTPEWDFLQPMTIQWCAVENHDAHYVLGSTYASGQTHGLWPGEARPGGADYEIIFHPVIYQPGQVEVLSFTVYGGPGSLEKFRQNRLQKTSGQSEEQMEMVPRQLTLHQNYPNPFNPTTMIQFELPKPDRVFLAVYNTLGQEVALLADGYLNAGTYTRSFDASNLSAGVYYSILRTGGSTRVHKMLLIK
ncbi:MAG: T9SS type A sorting domain-containing protein [Ignavibacteria bacterium]|nr:T9SS type A sorting domain-containing protein [Ignavibacteria bacterium]